MGWRWEVSADRGGYSYESVYQGESVLGAIRATLRAKRAGASCVKIEWR